MNMFRMRSTAYLALMALFGPVVIGAIALAVYVGLQEPETSQPSLEESPRTTPLIYALPGLEPTPGTGEPKLPHDAPSLVRPQEGAVFSLSDPFGVTLVWTGDEDLDHAEAFYVQIWCTEDEGSNQTERWTKRTQLTLTWMDQMDCDSDRYFWSVTIYRIDRITSTGERIGTPSSPPSVSRSFIWRSVRSEEG